MVAIERAVLILLLIFSCTWLPAQCRHGQDSEGSLTAGGLTRTYLVHLPASYEAGRASPLVLVFHGGGGRSAGVDRLTGLNALADREGFIVVYPEAVDRQWNDGRRARAVSGVDDLAFVETLLITLAQKYNIDRSRVYACGISNGGFFAEYLALKMPDRLAAVGAVAATVPADLRAVGSGRPVPIVFFIGREDPLVPFKGGPIGLKRKGPLSGLRKPQDRGEVIPASESIEYWIRNNRAASAPSVKLLPDSAPRDGTRVTAELYAGGPSGADVLAYMISGGGHTWPGGRQYLPEAVIGRTSRDIDASALLWDFFRKHNLR